MPEWSFEPIVMSISGFLKNFQPLSKDPHQREQLGGIWAQLLYKIASEHVGDDGIT